jgi:hypothetical protein
MEMAAYNAVSTAHLDWGRNRPKRIMTFAIPCRNRPRQFRNHYVKHEAT